MINAKAMQSLFNPYVIPSKNVDDLLAVIGMDLKDLVKINVECECSKSIDESCINKECHHNLFDLHKDELYVEVLQEIQAKRKEIEEKTKRDIQKYYGTSFGD